jgi:hypothetical protein
MSEVWDTASHTSLEALQALVPLALLAGVLIVGVLRVPREFIGTTLRGLALTFLGLFIFLLGVRVGFLPAGLEVGRSLARLDNPALVLLIGLVLGFSATLAEPAVRILGGKVEEVSSGYISARLILYAISVGVALSVALSLARILWGVSLLYFVLPGYALVLLLLPISDRRFTSLAFDAGGVATGAMTVTFIVAVALGLAEGIPGRDPVRDGLGLIALVALIPIASVIALGLLFRWREGTNGRTET